MDEDDLKWVVKEKNIVLFKHFHDNFLSKSPRCRKFTHSSQMQNDALMHCEGLKGLALVIGKLGMFSEM